MIECSPEGIAVVRDARWIFVNRALAEALGYAHAERLIGQPAGELVHPDDGAIAAALHAEPYDRTRQLRYRRANGEYALMEVRPAELSEFEGAPALLLAAHDITEQKCLEAQSLATERLVSMGTLAASVAHELNNPLGALTGQLEWIAQRLDHVREGACESAATVELKRLIQPIAEARDAAARMRAIVRDLKLFSRPEDDAQVPVDLRDVLDSAARMAWNELRHRARFVRSYDDVPLVRGSEARLGQVFLNLLVNACQAIPEGDAGAHEVRLSARCLDSQEVLVEVRDSGCGIAPKTLERIFEPFFTTKPAGVGSGLGLSICRRIVTSMGGRIEVESELGLGSTFRVYLSCAQVHEHRSERAGEALVRAEPSVGRGRVLVVDDDPAMASAIELVLADEHDVQVLTSAQRALDRLRAGESYDAIVCDVMMPGMSGMDFHAELAVIAPQQADQVIFLTGGAFTRRAREFLDRTDNSWLDKPFDSQSLRNLVSQRIARAR
jgi:PAS domain S-box-containing protein